VCQHLSQKLASFCDIASAKWERLTSSWWPRAIALFESAKLWEITFTMNIFYFPFLEYVKHRNIMTNDSCRNLIDFVCDQLKEVSDFTTDTETLIKKFRLDRGFGRELMERFDYPHKKLFNWKVWHNDAEDTEKITFHRL
jgi:hypothetical protein